MKNTLIISHQRECLDKNLFSVIRQIDGKHSDPVHLFPPDSIKIEGRPSSDLTQDMRWYLEEYLDFPMGGNKGFAERVLDGIKTWGENTFNGLFSGRARDWYQNIRHSTNNLDLLTIKIASDDPQILSWPWEVLRDPEGTTLAHTCRIERQLNNLHDPLPLPINLPNDRINILLIIPRPYGDNDVGYHAVSRPLVNLARQKLVPIQIDLLRPPTFSQLQQTLQNKFGFYHIVHFDGHGGYGNDEHSPSSVSFKGARGKLIFETEEGDDDPVNSEQLTQLLTEHRIPIMVLNACQSARIDDLADDAFASVAAALLKAGTRSVVAMGYNLWVSGAQQFVPGFYQRLFNTGNISEAVRAGRKAMCEKPNRVSLVGETVLQDWMVPVLYQQDPFQFNFTATHDEPVSTTISLPKEALELDDDEFIGREHAIHALERAIQHQPQAAILIYGMAGIGKSTLVKGFLHWLHNTQGLGQGLFWFNFDEIHSFEYVVNKLVDDIFDDNTSLMPLEKKTSLLINTLQQDSYLIVWDNFESVFGVPETEITPLLTKSDQEQLKSFLQQLRQSETTVLINSRSPENWLEIESVYRLPLSGFHGEECWLYCNMIVANLGLRIPRNDKYYAQLITALDGHPLMIRAVLIRLVETNPAILWEEVNQQISEIVGDENTHKIFDAFSMLSPIFSDELKPIIQLIGLHRRFVNLDFVEIMCATTMNTLKKNSVNACFKRLETAGILHYRRNNIYSIHPALSGFQYLRNSSLKSLQLNFVIFIGQLAKKHTNKEVHEQYQVFNLHGASFYHALALANQLEMVDYVEILTLHLAVFARNNRNFIESLRLFESLEKLYKHFKNEKGIAFVYFQLGVTAQAQREFKNAKRWYQKSLDIDENNGNNHRLADTYHNLGIIAQEQLDFKTAEHFLQNSLAIKENEGNEHGAAETYHELGMIAFQQGNFKIAEKFHHKALIIFEKEGIESFVATTYLQMGMTAFEQSNFKTAEDWYYKSIAIFHKQSNEFGLSKAYHELGLVAQQQKDSLAAKEWFQKSLVIKEKQGNEHGGALTCIQLGLLTNIEDYLTAGEWMIKAAKGFIKTVDEYNFAKVVERYGILIRVCGDKSAIPLESLWSEAGLDLKILKDKLKELPPWPPPIQE